MRDSQAVRPQTASLFGHTMIYIIIFHDQATLQSFQPYGALGAHINHIKNFWGKIKENVGMNW